MKNNLICGMIKKIVRKLFKQEDLSLYPVSDKYPKRYNIINFIIEQHGFNTYLEIGCRLDGSFRKVNSKIKFGVDPNSGGTHRMTSDEFFETNTQVFDVIFVDGLHWSEQVTKDIRNGLQHLSPNGFIVVHDCLPQKESHQLYPMDLSVSSEDNLSNLWLGDCWKAVVTLNGQSDVDFITLDTDFGCSVVKRKNSDAKPVSEHLDFEYFQQNRNELMNIATDAEFEQWVKE